MIQIFSSYLHIDVQTLELWFMKNDKHIPVLNEKIPLNNWDAGRGFFAILNNTSQLLIRKLKGNEKFLISCLTRNYVLCDW